MLGSQRTFPPFYFLSQKKYRNMRQCSSSTHTGETLPPAGQSFSCVQLRVPVKLQSEESFQRLTLFLWAGLSLFFGADDDPNTGKLNATPTSSLLSYFIIKAHTENTIQVFERTLYFERLCLSVMCLGTIPTSQPPPADAVTLQHEGQRPRCEWLK